MDLDENFIIIVSTSVIGKPVPKLSEIETLIKFEAIYTLYLFL